MKYLVMLFAVLGLTVLPTMSHVHAQEAAEPAMAEEDLGDIDKDALKAEVDALQEDILANDALMAEIEELLKDEEIVKLLSNPELVAAITSYDPTQIESNVSVQELMKNPKVNELIEKIGKLYENQAAEEAAIQ